MNKIVYSYVLLIFILNEEVTSSLVELNTRNQTNVDAEKRRLRVTKNLEYVFYCLQNYHQRSLRIDIVERFGDILQNEVRSCASSKDRQSNEVKRQMEGLEEKCLVPEKKALEQTLISINEVELNCVDMTDTNCFKLKSLMISSRDAMDQCLRKTLDQLKNPIINIIQSVMPCVSKTRTPSTYSANEIAEMRKDIESSQFCSIN